MATLGLKQLIDTIGLATANALGIPDLQLVRIELSHALDYLPDDHPFFDDCVRMLMPSVVSALVGAEASTQEVAPEGRKG